MTVTSAMDAFRRTLCALSLAVALPVSGLALAVETVAVENGPVQRLGFPDVMEETVPQVDARAILREFDAPNMFSASDEATANIGFSKHAWWLHSRLRATGTTLAERVVVLGHPLLRDVDFYLRHADGRIESIARSAQRGTPHATIQLPPNGKDVDLFVRVKSQHPLVLPFALYTPVAYAESRESRRMITGLVIGILAALVAYNLLLAVALRKRNYRWLSLHLFSFALLLLAMQGLGDELLSTLTSQPSTNLFYSALSFAMFGMLAYAFSLLGLGKQLLMAGRVVKGLAILRLLLAILALLLPSQWLAQLSVALLVPDVVAIATPAIILAMRGSKPARLLLLAWTVLMGLLIADCLLAFAVLPALGAVTIGLVVAILIGAAVITFASVLRYESLHEQYQSVTTQWEHTLERGVAARTHSMATTMAVLNDANQRLRDANDRDGLTGIYNRRYYDHSIEPQLSLSRTTGRPFSALVADIDCFKHINDTVGHLVGDDCIRMVANTLQQHLNRDQPLVRYGGEEFVILLPGMTATMAMAKAEQLRAAVAAAQVACNGKAIRMTISIGVATIAVNERVSAETLIRSADTALYLAKAEGRNRVVHSGANVQPTWG
ncbi:MAG: diguanylate cyclase [Dokdonella sp.]